MPFEAVISKTKTPPSCAICRRENSSSPRTLEGWTKPEKIEEFRSSTYARENPSQLPLPKILSDLFEWTGKPLELDNVVTIIAALMNVRDQSHEVFDEQSEAYFEVPVARETSQPRHRLGRGRLLLRRGKPLRDRAELTVVSELIGIQPNCQVI